VEKAEGALATTDGDKVASNTQRDNGIDEKE
jgi:hypothetical protein